MVKHVISTDGLKLEWLEDLVWFKLRPTRALKLPKESSTLEGWFDYTCQVNQVKVPSYMNSIEQDVAIPIMAGSRSHQIVIKFDEMRVILANICLNGFAVSSRDAPI